MTERGPLPLPMRAPNFGGNFPMGGSLIGPAWQAGWDLLRAVDEKSWVERALLVDTMMTAGTGIAEKTAGNLIGYAVRCEILAKRGKPGSLEYQILRKALSS